MAITNHERVGKAVELLRAGLAPYVEREFASAHKDRALAEARRLLSPDDRLSAKKPIAQWDAAVLLKIMWDAWNDIFGRTLGRAERSLVQELREVRNRWAHQETFSSDDAYRSLDSVHRLLLAVSATEAEEVEKLKMELLRVRFDEQARGEKRKTAGTAITTTYAGHMAQLSVSSQPVMAVALSRAKSAGFSV